jgi:hypothetical protein
MPDVCSLLWTHPASSSSSSINNVHFYRAQWSISSPTEQIRESGADKQLADMRKLHTLLRRIQCTMRVSWEYDTKRTTEGWLPFFPIMRVSWEFHNKTHHSRLASFSPFYHSVVLTVNTSVRLLEFQSNTNTLQEDSEKTFFGSEETRMVNLPLHKVDCNAVCTARSCAKRNRWMRDNCQGS